jgi:hypothetical protein
MCILILAANHRAISFVFNGELWVMRKNPPRLELSFRSFKLIAEEHEAIAVVRWPIRLVIVVIAVCLLVAAFSIHPITWGQALVVWLSSLI